MPGCSTALPRPDTHLCWPTGLPGRRVREGWLERNTGLPRRRCYTRLVRKQIRRNAREVERRRWRKSGGLSRRTRGRGMDAERNQHHGWFEVDCRQPRRDAREAEGAPLLREYRVKSLIEGSNPSLSAIQSLTCLLRQPIIRGSLQQFQCARSSAG